MAKIEGPWGNNEPDNPWQTVPKENKKSKVVNFTMLQNQTPDNFSFKFSWVVIILILVWAASGFYQVQPNEKGVVLRFGKYIETTEAGLHYHLPYPIEEVLKVNFSQERSINLGVQEAYSVRNRAVVRKDDALKSFTESHMLTGDENIVDVNLTIVWKKFV